MRRTSALALLALLALTTACGDATQAEDFWCEAHIDTSAGPVDISAPGNCEELERMGENQKAHPEG